jgi:hypothetical protein
LDPAIVKKRMRGKIREKMKKYRLRTVRTTS